MSTIHKCLLIVEGGKIQVFMVDKGKIEELISGEDFIIDIIDSFWKWWVNAIEFIQTEDLIDICTISDCPNIDINVKFNCLERAKWYDEEIFNYCTNVFNQNSIKLNYYINGEMVTKIIDTNLKLFNGKIDRKNLYVKVHNGEVIKNTNSIIQKSEVEFARKSELKEFFTRY